MAVNVINVGDLAEEDSQVQLNSVMSDSITQNWTEQALECYKLNCNCSNCSVSRGGYSFECQMPKVLDILIKTLGTPVQKANLKLVKK